MSAQNWGELSGYRRGGHVRQQSSEYDLPIGFPAELDSQLPKKADRMSIQTAFTENESIFAVPPSPAASSVAPRGLAPRPPSYQRPRFTQATSESSDRQARQMSYFGNDEDDQGYFPIDPSNSASRGPPLSFRLQQPPAAGSQAPQPAFPKRHTSLFQGLIGISGNNYPQSREISSSGSSMATPNMAAPTIGDAHPRVEDNAQPRKSFAGATSDRRKMLATNRSPLQTLELTLDSMTKEEKRARVEAAEQRARERATRSAHPSAVPPNASRAATGDVTMIQAMSTARQGTNAEPRSRPSERHNWPQQIPQTTPASISPPGQTSDFPNHNLSFYDRAMRSSAAPHSPDTPEHLKQRSSPNDSLDRSHVRMRQEPREPFYDRAASEALPSNRRSTLGMGVARHHYQDKELPPLPVPQNSQIEATQWHGAHDIQDNQHRATESSQRHQYGVNKRYSSLAQPVPAPVQPVPTPAQPVPAFQEPQNVTQDGMIATGRQYGANKRYSALAQPVQAPVQPVPAFQEPQNVTQDGMIAIGRQYGANKRYSALAQPVPAFQEPHNVTEDGMIATGRRLERTEKRTESDEESVHEIHPRPVNMLYSNHDVLRPGEGLYQSPEWLDEWKKAAVGSLTGPLVDVHADHPSHDTQNTWWEQGKGHGGNPAPRLRKAEAFDGEYDDTKEPTRFKPQLYLKCGPLLRYCGIRKEGIPSRSQHGHAVSDREIWRGSIMIVTQDSESSYEIAPMLRLFVQDLESLPQAPHHVNGDLSPEFVDHIAGHPKLGRRGETLYVRPVDHLIGGKDLSRDETDDGLFKASRNSSNVSLPPGVVELPGSLVSRKSRTGIDGERTRKYRDVRGFQLHTERGYTFWRFNIEVELRQKQQRIAYRINRGPCMAFWVPEKGQTMNIMFYSCNGFSASVNPDDFSGPDPMWRDVLNTHQTKPFHVMVGGGDQIYNDRVGDECELFGEWLDCRNAFNKHYTLFTAEMQNQLERFYLERYCMWFSQGLFGLATSQIPMVNMYDDHDIFDGYGSYPDRDMRSPVFCGLGAVAFKYYMLFQHQSIIPETEISEPSWILGVKPGPYIREVSRSVFVSMGGKTALLAVDTRTERTENEVVYEKTWEKITSRLYVEVRRGQVEHLLVVLSVPIAYPRMVWLENILTSRLMDPVKALGRTGVLGKMLNKIDGGVEVLDDMNDHWTTKNHKQERTVVIEDLQDLAMDKSVRVTILSGDVHVAAVGQFYSKPQLRLAKHKDPRYMPNIVSSAIVNTPPPDILVDALNKRNRVHHFDKSTDEGMIPLFRHGPDGKPRNNKRLLPHRNWCSIRQWLPGATPPPTPPLTDDEGSPDARPAAGGGSLLRRLSLGKRPEARRIDGSREAVRGSRPPASGGTFRNLNREDAEEDVSGPVKSRRSMTVGSINRPKVGFMGLARNGSQRRASSEYDDEDDSSMEGWNKRASGPYPSPYGQSQEEHLGLRGGGSTNDEYSDGDETYFSRQAPKRAQAAGDQARQEFHEDAGSRPFYRTPTGLSTKQMKNAQKYAVDLEGGLDIRINVEVNAQDPTGMTVPYRLLVPRLYYEYNEEEDSLAEAQTQPAEQAGGLKRFLSFRKGSASDGAA